MAILDVNKYYYFRMRNGNPYAIKESIVEINTNIMRNFQEMTTEQREFYFEHPTASVMEVWNCEIIPPYVPPAPDVSEYAAQKVKDLNDACYASVTITSLEYAMAEDKVNNLTADSYYSISQAREILSTFRTQTKKAMQVRDTYTPQIQASQSIEAVDTLYNQAIEQL